MPRVTRGQKVQESVPPEGKKEAIGKSKPDITLLAWLKLNLDLIKDTADMLRKEIDVISDVKIKRHQASLEAEDRPEAEKLSKNIVTSVQNAVSKAVNDLEELRSGMHEELRARYDLGDDWNQSTSNGSSVVSSTAATLGSKKTETESGRKTRQGGSKKLGGGENRDEVSKKLDGGEIRDEERNKLGGCEASEEDITEPADETLEEFTMELADALERERQDTKEGGGKNQEEDMAEGDSTPEEDIAAGYKSQVEDITEGDKSQEEDITEGVNIQEEDITDTTEGDKTQEEDVTDTTEDDKTREENVLGGDETLDIPAENITKAIESHEVNITGATEGDETPDTRKVSNTEGDETREESIAEGDETREESIAEGDETGKESIAEFDDKAQDEPEEVITCRMSSPISHNLDRSIPSSPELFFSTPTGGIRTRNNEEKMEESMGSPLPADEFSIDHEAPPTSPGSGCIPRLESSPNVNDGETKKDEEEAMEEAPQENSEKVNDDKKMSTRRQAVTSKTEVDAKGSLLASGSDSDDSYKPSSSQSKSQGRLQRKKKNETGEQEKKKEAKPASTKAKKLLSDDPKLKEDASYVHLLKMDPKILAKLEQDKFIILENYNELGKKTLKRKPTEESDSDDDFDSDDTLKQLKLAVKKLTKKSFLQTVDFRKRTHRRIPVPGEKKKNSGTKRGRRRQNTSETLHSGSEDESPSGLRNQREMNSDDEIIYPKSGGSSSDMEMMSEDETQKKKKQRKESAKAKEKDQTSNKKKTQKKYLSAKVTSSESDEDEEKVMRNLLKADSDMSESDSESEKKSKKSGRKKDGTSGSDSDASSKTTVLAKKKKKIKKEEDIVRLSSDTDSDKTTMIVKVESDSDSDFISKKPNTRKAQVNKKKKPADTDSDVSIISIHSDSSDSDPDFKKKVSNKRKRKDDNLDNKAKKKRRRVKNMDSDDEDSNKKSNDSDIEEVSHDEDNEGGSSQKGRKNIRKIMSSRELAKTTKEAEREEDNRRKRLSDRQKLFNGIHKVPESDKLERLVLDVKPETKEPFIEIDTTIATKLKPHQAEGIRFMYNACFESVKMIEEEKVPGGCILAHCMGLGKTLQSVAFIHTLLTHPICKIKTALIICPLSTVTNWFNEFKQWTSEAKHINLHKIYEAKASMESRIDYLRTWHRRGGVGIIHYDMFVRLADPKKKNKMKERLRKVVEETLLDPGPDIVICDEGHLLKNWKSQRALAVNQIRAKRRVVLTGTPLQNNLVEYHTMMNFVKPNLLGSLPEFTNRFVNPIQNGQHADSTDEDVRKMKSRAHVLHRKLEGCVQRFDYSILAPYLPPKYEYIINIQLSKKQEELYKLYLTSVIGNMDYDQRRRGLLKFYSELVKVWSHPIALTMGRNKDFIDDEESSDEGSLKDFINDESELESDKITDVESGEGSNDSKPSSSKKVQARRTRSKGLDPDAPRDLPEGGIGGKWWSPCFNSKEEMYDVSLSGKLVILQEILRTCESIGDRVLVFSQFLTSLDIIEEFLEDWDKEAQEKEKQDGGIVTFPLSEAMCEGRWRKDIEYFRIDGGVKQIERQKNCDKFNRKSTLSRAKLFLISTKAGGLGINLYGANRVVIFDASWNPSQDMQSIFRVYRFGQDKPCYIYRLIAKGTMEQKILRRQITKLSLSSRVVDEHQIQRHFKFDDVNELYRYDEDVDDSASSSMSVPKDKLLADLILSHASLIKGYEEFDSLLENRPDEGLSKEEKELAWAEYRVESDRQKMTGSISMSHDVEVQTYLKVKSRLVAGYPSASEGQIEEATQTSINVINKIRGFMLMQNNLPDERRTELDPLIDPLKLWLQNSVNANPEANATVPPDPAPILRPIPIQYNMIPNRADFLPINPNVRPPMPRSRAPLLSRYQQQPAHAQIQNIQNSFANLAASNFQQNHNVNFNTVRQQLSQMRNHPRPQYPQMNARDPLS